ncbi:MAG: hypothetical protein ACRD16_16830 [Thermoanaerobaculia bacterium]
MRIENLRLQDLPDQIRALATVVWEESARSPVEVWFETPREFAEAFRADPNAFLLACVIPAVRHGERRILLDGPVCPQLCEGLQVVMGLLHQWHGESRRPLRIESQAGERAPEPRAPARAAFFLSGGVDSMHLLLTNRAKFPLEHPASFRDAVFVYGRDFPGAEDSPEARDFLRRSLENLNPLAREQALELVPVGSNARVLESDHEFFLLEYFGSFLVAAAMTMSRRWSLVSLASSWDLGHLRPWGSHPLLDTAFATAALGVRHEGAVHTRMEKLFEIANSEAALGRLVVCNHGPSAPWLNCGRCGKCLLTLSALFLSGRLESASTFPPGSLTAESIEKLSVDGDFADLWRQRLEPLQRSGRADLARAVEAKVLEGERHRRWVRRRGWKGLLRRIDDRVFRGRVRTIVRRRGIRKSNRSTSP